MKGNVIAETDWEQNRLGKITSSKCSVLLTQPRTKKAKEAGEISKTTKLYLDEKVSELLTGTIRREQFFSMEWGQTYESEALERLKLTYPDIEYFGVDNQKFYQYTEFSGGSPDGICFNIVFEVKCPENPANHIKYLQYMTEDEFKKYCFDYWCQLQMNMMCVAKVTEQNFEDMEGVFASYSPLMFDDKLRLKILHIKPDIVFKKLMDEKIKQATSHMSDVVNDIVKQS